MNAKNTILINGKAYDITTGLPVSEALVEEIMHETPVAARVQPTEAHREPTHPSNIVHQQVQKSSTLRRGHLKQPVSKVPVAAPSHHAGIHVAHSDMITHFASHPQPLPKQHSTRMINDIGPIVRQAVMAPSTKSKLSTQEVKNRLLARASETIDKKVAAPSAKHAKPKAVSLLRRLKKSHLVTAGAAVLVLIGYIAYLNVPSLSVRLAAAQSGVHASYPSYNPDGYSFAGPVAFQQGEVDLQFKSNGGGEGYTIIQRNSDWNSVAVLDNLVDKASNGVYQANSAGGITVYTYGTKAAWTNGGVLYTIDGKAPLSSDQLLRIASSM